MDVLIKPISYRIAMPKGPKIVYGFAVHGKTGVRYCVRQQDDYSGSWVADDFDTGHALKRDLWIFDSMKKLIETCEKDLPASVSSGRYQRGLDAAAELLKSNPNFDGELYE